MTQAILTRESDGLRFEPCYHPGLVRCEACLALCEPAAIREHRCVDWWSVDMADLRLGPETEPATQEARRLWAQFRVGER